MDDIRSKLAAEALMNLLFGCAGNEELCTMIAGKDVDLISILPLLRVLVPALRIPSKIIGAHLDIETNAPKKKLLRDKKQKFLQRWRKRLISLSP